MDSSLLKPLGCIFRRREPGPESALLLRLGTSARASVLMASDRPIPLDVLNLKFGSNFHLDLELQCVPDHIIHSPRPGATAVRFRIDIQ